MKRSVIITCLVCLAAKAYTAPAPFFGLYDWFASYYDESPDDDSKDIYDEIMDYFFDTFCSEKSKETSKPDEIKSNSSVQTGSVAVVITKQNSTLKDQVTTTSVQELTTAPQETKSTASE